MKILLLGAAGQVGFELQRSLVPLGDVVAATRDGRLPAGASAQVADLADSTSLQGLLDSQRPDVIVNAAAYTAVDRAESEPAQAMKINAQGPAFLARWSAANGARLVHFSTDYVFDGQATRPWREGDATSPLGVYGQSKRDGELAIVESGAEYLIVRTAWVYAARGQNFLRTMLRLAEERDHLRVVNDQMGAPTPARWIAAATAAILARWQVGTPWQSDIVHLTAAGQTSWFGFAEAIFAQAHAAELLPSRPQLEPIPSSAYPTPAQRPAYSVLDNSRLQARFGVCLPDWREGLSQVLSELIR